MRLTSSVLRTALCGLAVAVCAGPAAAVTDVMVGNPASSGTIAVLVELSDPPAARVYGETLRKGLGKAAAVAAGRAQHEKNKGSLRSLAARLTDGRMKGREIYRVGRVVNGVAVEIDASLLSEVAKLPGVRRVQVLEPEYPTNSTSVPFIGAPALWGNSLGLPSTLTGAGMTIGIIDTGVDYQHPSFGGSGVLADYQANDRTVATDVFFPTARVVGGWDFAGDGYTGSAATVAPDADPMDCNGHGSHVAGTAAGGGVNADGTPYSGPYGPSTNFAGLRIGPGVAPQASLFALRVFGCGGSTNLTVDAINWAIDPNDDGDFSDHLDVINMSLGSTFGTVTSTSATASEDAAVAGVVVVASAGNSGDTYFITGSPGVSGRTISVAAVADDGLAGPGVRVNAPAGIAGTYAAGTAAFGGIPPASGLTANVVVGLDPSDIAGPTTTDGCSAFTNAAAVAGNIALVDRGTCGFALKVKNAQNAGAVGVIVANNVAGAPGMGGTDPTITIPSVMVSLADGTTFKANIAGLNVTLLPAGDTLASFSSRGPRLAGSPIRLKPDLAAPGSSITSVQTGVTCTGTAPSSGCLVANASGFIAGGQALVLSGTSMAAPHMAGSMALLRQAHPDWSVEELKALAMNTALHDVTVLPGGAGAKYGPSRVGDGRVDLALAAAANAVAFNAEDTGLVSVSFDDREVVGTLTQQKTIRVVNKSAAPQTFDLSVVTVVDAPGVTVTLPAGSSVTVPALSTATFPVQMSADAAQMDHGREATVASTQVVGTPGSLANLAIPRHWLTEEGGYVVLSQGGAAKLRVPVYVPPRPASRMAAPATIVTGGAPTGSTTIPLAGTDVCTGTLGAGPACTGVFPNDVASLVSPFELQVVSPANPAIAPPYADIQYVGVAADATRIWFGISTWGDWSTPTDVSFTIYVDNNNDGTYERQVFNTSSGNLARRFFGAGSGQSDTDAFIVSVFTSPGTFSNVIAASTPNYVNRLSAASTESALFNNNVMFIGATPSQLGLAGVTSPFRYKVESCPGWATLCQAFSGFHYDEALGPYSWNGGAPGLSFSGTTLAQDLNGASLPVSWNTANMAANGSLGALLLHHHNAAGERAQVVLLGAGASADLSVALGVAPASPAFGTNVTLTVTAANSGPDAATGVQVVLAAPAGLVWVSDTSAGALNTSTGIWSIPSLASGASTSIQVVLRVDSTDPMTATASIAAASPLDPNLANNNASVSLQALSSADVQVSVLAAPASALPGDPLSYTVTVRNLGVDTAYGLNVSVAFPSAPGLVPTSFTASAGTYLPATGQWTFATLGSGVAATLQVTVTAPSFIGAFAAQATATATTSDPNTANNAASASVTLASPALIAPTKTASGSLFAGAVVTYTVTLPNTSSYAQFDNPGDEFVDVLPAGVALVSASATSGTALADTGTNTVTWNGPIPAGGSVTITIQARILTQAAGTTISNQGTVHYDADGNGTNEATVLTDDPAVGGTADPTVLQASAQAPIPAASTLGLALLGLLTALGAVLVLRSRVVG